MKLNILGYFGQAIELRYELWNFFVSYPSLIFARRTAMALDLEIWHFIKRDNGAVSSRYTWHPMKDLFVNESFTQHQLLVELK